MTAQIIDGKALANDMLLSATKERERLGVTGRLAVVLIGDNPNLRTFVALKQRACERAGFDFRLHAFPESITTTTLRKELTTIARVTTNTAILLELPLPTHLNLQYLLNAIPEHKDVDVLSQKAQGAFFANRSPVLPPSVVAVRTILEHTDIIPKENPKDNPMVLAGTTAAVFGYGLLVGKPVSHWLAQHGATVTVINEHTPNPATHAQRASIVVSGVGKPHIVTADMMGEGSVVIDFGMGKGDVAFDEVTEKASAITPVPGGVGPIVVASVVHNLLVLSRAQTSHGH